MDAASCLAGLSEHPWFAAAGLLVAAGAVRGLLRLVRIVPIAAAYKAKVLCSAVFVSGRDPASVLAEDVAVDSYRPLRLFRAEVDRGRRSVTVSLAGLASRTAACSPGFGAALVFGLGGGAAPPAVEDAPFPARGGAWPEGDSGPDAAVPPALAKVLEDAFSEPRPRRLRRTRAVAVSLGGRLAAERYAPGFGPDSALAGWSMTKSVTHALTGVLVAEGKLSLDAAALLPEDRKSVV